MNRFYRVNSKELAFLQGFAGVILTPWGDTVAHQQPQEMKACADTLEEKSYLMQTEKGQYLMEEGLEHLFRIAADATEFLLMSKNNESMETVYFKQDGIAIFQQQNMNEIELIWIPVIPLLIGQIANTITPFMNARSDEPKVYPRSEENTILIPYREADYQLQWSFLFYSQGKLAETIRVFTNGNVQIMVTVDNEHIYIGKPDKKDMMNAISQQLIKLHGQTMREVVS